MTWPKLRQGIIIRRNQTWPKLRRGVIVGIGNLTWPKIRKGMIERKIKKQDLAKTESANKYIKNI